MVERLSVLIVPLLALLLVVFIGCASFQDVVTPCYIDTDAVAFAGQEPNDVKVLGLYTSLWDAKRLAARIDYVADENQKQLTRMLVDNVDRHAYLAGNHVKYIADAEEFKQTAFSPSGPIGMMLPMATAFGIGALGISKPKDKRKIDSLNKVTPPKPA